MRPAAKLMALALAASLCLIAQSATDIEGAWKLKSYQGEHVNEFSLVLKAEASGLTGNITGPDGRPVELTNASFSGGLLRFTVVIDGNSYQVEGKLDNGKLAGSYKGPDSDAGKWEAERAPEKNPFDSAADAEVGKKYFLGHCALCHGPEGEGGRGVNLTTGVYRHGGSDRELFTTIRRGIRGTEMPGAGLSEKETWRVVAFVRRLAGAAEKAAGNPHSGRTIYLAKGGCAQCHVVDKGEGGVLGPDLAEIGLRRSLKFLRQALTDPDVYVADDYQTVTVVTRTGEQITGVRVSEDDYSIHLRDSRETLRSFLKRNLKDHRREKRSLMPGYGTALSATEIEDLVAYLSSLRGSEKPKQ